MLCKRVATLNGGSWDWEPIARLNGQSFPQLKIQTSLVQDAITCELDAMEPDTLPPSGDRVESASGIDDSDDEDAC